MSDCYQPTWSSLATHPTPRGFLEASTAFCMHWGPYSVAAYGANGTWYPRHMYHPERPQYRYHSETLGPPKQSGHKELIERFTADQFDAYRPLAEGRPRLHLQDPIRPGELNSEFSQTALTGGLAQPPRRRCPVCRSPLDTVFPLGTAQKIPIVV